MDRFAINQPSCYSAEYVRSESIFGILGRRQFLVGYRDQAMCPQPLKSSFYHNGAMSGSYLAQAPRGSVR